VKGGFLLNVIVTQSSSVFQLLASEDQSLLVRWNALLILDLRLHVVDGVRRLDLQRDGLPREGFDKNLHTTTETKDQVESRLLLDVVIGESASIFELLSGENQALLIRGDSLLVLDLRLDVVNGIRRLYFKSDGLAGQGLDENLHTTTQTEDKVKGRLLLDIVVGEGTAILKLLAGEDQALLVGRDPFLVLNLGLDVIDGVGGLNLEGDGLPRQGLDEDLHSSAETEDQVESRLLLNVVVAQGTTIFELLASEDETLLVGRDALLVLDLSLDVIDGVRGLDLEGDGLSGESLNEDLHVGMWRTCRGSGGC